MRYLKLWTNFSEVISSLSDAEIGRLFLAMLRYVETGEEPLLFKGNEAFLWPVAKRDIDMANAKQETLRQNGLKGGRPKSKDNQEKPNETKENQTEANERLKEKKRKEKKGNENNKYIFTAPTVEEVKAYCEERKNGIDPEYFVDYQTARNWILSNGKQAKDWKAVIRTWEKNNFNRARTPTKTVIAQQYQQRDYSEVQKEFEDDISAEMELFLKG